MKSKNKILKRLISLSLAGTMFAAVLPSNSVFANLQSHVTNVTIGSVPTGNSNYSIDFTWTNPATWSTESDNNAVESDKSAMHSPEGFLIQGLNATAGETKYTEYDDVAGADVLGDTITPVDPLNSGSIYEFQVLPYHYHYYLRNNVNVRDRAPYASGNPESVLFMTDINVSATGSGNTLSVSWDNPQYKGSDVFTGYRIYYQRGGDKVTNFNTYKDVSIDDASITKQTDKTRDGVQILSYDIYDANLIQGEYYAVKVEPLYNGAPIRDLSSGGRTYKNVVINNQSYRISFRYMTEKEYRTNEASIKIPLEVLEDGKNFLKLHWWGISNTIGNIDRIEIYDGDAESDIGNKIGTIYSSQALYVNYWQIDKPDTKKYYQLRIYVDGKTTPVESAIAYYDPSIVNITPNKPDMYVSVNNQGSTSSLDVYWDAFVRYPYNDNEKAFARPDGTYIDTDVVYDMWITDSLTTVKDVNLNIKALSRVSASDLQLTENENLDLPCYMTNLTQYVTTDANGGYVSKNIEKNKTYYIKLVATKPTSDGYDKSAEPVYISVYVPTNEDISNPEALNKPPLRIKEDTNGKKVIDQSSITVEWNNNWYEVYDEKTDNWYGIVALRGSELIYGYENIDEDTDTQIPLYTAESEDEARELFKEAGLSDDTVAALQIRKIDLSSDDIKYELKYVPFDDINSEGGYQTYLNKLLNDDSDAWEDITPSRNGNNYLEYKVSGLNKNTAYVIMLRPYRTLSDGTKKAYPTYVIGTTLPDDTDVEIKPTVPSLQEVEHDDVSFQVKWEQHTPSLDYELAVSETVIDDPATAQIFISSDDIKKNGIEKSEDLKLFMYYTVKNLFPKTGYYVWVRSIAHNTSGDSYSEWSNPIYIETDELAPPDAPDGLGLASKENLKIYNLANSTDYISSNYNYIIVEWLKDANDEEYTAVTNTSGTGYEVLDNPDFKNTYIVKYDGLNANQLYYFRVKTRLTVSKGTDGSSVKKYAYVVQMSENDKFDEVVEVIVPEDTSGTNNATTRFYVMDSEWSDVEHFYTEPSSGEYDSDEDPDFYPLPDEDFEVIYDYPTRSLTYRFRSDEEDQEGLDDNLVDQRFISRLVQNKVFEFPIDLTSYMGGEIKQRIVEIPYSVMSAFDERKISLKVTANNGTFTFKPGFLDTPQVNNLYKYGQSATVKIIITEKPADSPALVYKQGYLSTPQNVGITIYTDTNVTVLDAAGENIGVSMKLDNRYSAIDSNVGLYYDTKATNAWNRLNFVYDNATGTYNTETARLATYAVIATAAPVATGTVNSQANSNIGNVTSKLNITDLSSFNPQKAVSVVQFNNIVAAIAAGKKDVTLSTALSTQDYTALSRKGLLLSGSVVSREQAVNALVKLYETKTGRQITYYTPLASSPYAAEIKQANASYQVAMLKAADLGFFETSNGVRPKDIMSLNELFYMTNIILQDSDY